LRARVRTTSPPCVGDYNQWRFQAGREVSGLEWCLGSLLTFAKSLGPAKAVTTNATDGEG